MCAKQISTLFCFKKFSKILHKTLDNGYKVIIIIIEISSQHARVLTLKTKEC